VLNLHKTTPILILLLFISCGNTNDPEPIKLDFTKVENTSNELSESQKPLTIAISAMTGPSETYKYYQDLIKYISKKIGQPVRLEQRRTYAEVNELLNRKEIDLAFVCSGGYVDAKQAGTVDLLVVPVIGNKTTYKSYLIVHKDSPDTCLEDLENKIFAFTDPLSQTGYNYPIYLLYNLSKTPEQFFSRFFFTYGHDRAIHAVSNGLADGACIDALIYDYLKIRRPFEIDDIRVIHRSREFGIPPVVIPSGLDKQMAQQLESQFLNMHLDDQGVRILNDLNIERFIRANDTLYNSIREIFNQVRN
jgi:phosphonate transport system substrate-binding protein